MRLKYKVTWDPRLRDQFDVPRGFLLLRPDNRYWRALGAYLTRAREAHNRRAEPAFVDRVEMDLTMEFDVRRRSLDLNALMWALYESEADLMNAERRGPGAVTKAQLYRQDMLAYAPSFIVRIPREGLPRLKKIVGENRVKEVLDEGHDLLVTVMETSSQWDSARMHLHVEMLFDRLAQMGAPIDRAGDLRKAWLEWRQALNDGKLVLHVEPMGETEYKDHQQSCESCGKFVGDGSGHLAHISSRGSGVTWGPEKRDPRDWLHLCPACHTAEPLEAQHNVGWSAFLERAPHLRFKVQEALRREVPGAVQREIALDGEAGPRRDYVLIGYEEPESPLSDPRSLTEAEAEQLNAALQEEAWVPVDELDSGKGEA